MPNYIFSFTSPVTMLLLGIFAASCTSNMRDVPFPISDTVLPQPVAQPLQMSAPVKLKWDTVKQGVINPDVKPFDMDKLPSLPLDADGFKPFAKVPQTEPFNIDSLPSTPIDLDTIPPTPLQYKTEDLHPHEIVAGALPTPKPDIEISVAQVGRPQGVPDKYVTCLKQDSRGFVWIGTDKGIYRYDGVGMQTIEQDFGGIADIIEDRQGRMWFTYKDGTGFIDLKNGTVSHCTTVATPAYFVSRMMLDGKGCIWISLTETKTIQGAVAVIDPQKQTYKIVDKNRGLTAESWSITMDKKNNIWVTTLGGVDIINPFGKKISHFKSQGFQYGDRAGNIACDNQGRIWLVTGNNGSVAAVDAVHDSITHYGDLVSPTGVFLTYHLICDSLGQLWVASTNGIFEISPEKGMVKHFSASQGMPGDHTCYLMEDNRQSIWAAVPSKSILVVYQNGKLTRLPNSKILSDFVEDDEGRVWASADYSGLYVTDERNNIIKRIRKKDGLGGDFIQNVRLEDGKIRIAYGEGGTDLIDLQNKIIQHIGKKQGLAVSMANSAFKDRSGNLWVGGRPQELEMIDAAKKMIVHTAVKQTLVGPDPYINNITDINADEKGRIWVASDSKGVGIIDSRSNTIQYINSAPGIMDTCSRILMPDMHGRMWIGTDKGIYITDIEKGTITTITTKEGLGDNTITSLIMYQGRVLAATHKSVGVITMPAYDNIGNSNSTNWQIGILAGTEDIDNEIGIASKSTATKKGQYIWADLSTAYIVNDIKEQKNGPPLYITSAAVMDNPTIFTNPVQLNEHDTLWDGNNFFVKGQARADNMAQSGMQWDSITGLYNLPVNLRIPYYQNSIQFQFGQPEPGTQLEGTYCYILQGYDKKWSRFTHKTYSGNYVNLSPGSYTFKVRCKDVQGFWGSEASFSFIITPPWWQKWWAYLLFVVTIAAVIWGFDYYRSRNLGNNNQLFAKLITQQ